MTQQVKKQNQTLTLTPTLTPKSAYLNLIPRTHMVERTKLLPDLHTQTNVCPQTNVAKEKAKLKFFLLRVLCLCPYFKYTKFYITLVQL